VEDVFFVHDSVETENKAKEVLKSQLASMSRSQHK